MNNLLSNKYPLYFLLPTDVLRALAENAKARRLAENLSRKTLAERSGVPAPTIRHFETTGQIGLLALLKLAEAMDCLSEFSSLFPKKNVLTVADIEKARRTRKRGRQ